MNDNILDTPPFQNKRFLHVMSIVGWITTFVGIPLVLLILLIDGANHTVEQAEKLDKLERQMLILEQKVK